MVNKAGPKAVLGDFLPAAITSGGAGKCLNDKGTCLFDDPE